MKQRSEGMPHTSLRRRSFEVFAVILVLGMAVRLLLLLYTANLEPKIADERQYLQLATSILHGRGYAWSTGEPTSLRPPLYPTFVAAVWTVARSTRPWVSTRRWRFLPLTFLAPS